MLESELGATVEEEFASFDFEPLAAASIGQTHRAVLKTGERVVVKVQRPGIEDVVHRDAAVLAHRREHRGAPGGGAPASSASSASPRSSSSRSSASSTTAPRQPTASAFLEHVEGRGRHRRARGVPGAVDAACARDGGDRRASRSPTTTAVEAAPVSAERCSPMRLLHSFLDQVLRDGHVPRRPTPRERVHRPRRARCGSSTSAPSAASAP